jgi:hypothetical protein
VLDTWVSCTNNYAKARLPPYQRKVITRKEILHFLEMVSYASVVQLPAKRYYFYTGRCEDASPLMPSHPTIKLKWTMFHYVWSNFHTSVEPGEQQLSQPYDPEDGEGGDANADDSVTGSEYQEYVDDRYEGYVDDDVYWEPPGLFDGEDDVPLASLVNNEETQRRRFGINPSKTLSTK